jgi:hypothetical protein
MVTDIIVKFANSHEKSSKPHQHQSIQTSQREQYHQTTQMEES